MFTWKNETCGKAYPFKSNKKNLFLKITPTFSGTHLHWNITSTTRKNQIKQKIISSSTIVNGFIGIEPPVKSGPIKRKTQIIISTVSSFPLLQHSQYRNRMLASSIWSITTHYTLSPMFYSISNNLFPPCQNSLFLGWKKKCFKLINRQKPEQHHHNT